jgi:hypothetical protein
VSEQLTPRGQFWRDDSSDIVMFEIIADCLYCGLLAQARSKMTEHQDFQKRYNRKLAIAAKHYSKMPGLI